MAAKDKGWSFEEEKTRPGGRSPVPDDEAPTPVPIVDTGRVPQLTPAEFASAVELAENDGYARGTKHGVAIGEASAVTEVRAYQEDVIEVFRAFWTIFELGDGRPAPPWPETIAWVRRRLTTP